MKVQVTEDLVKKGQRQSCLRCPIAIALKDVFGGKPDVWGSKSMTVDRRHVVVNSATDRNRIDNFITDFDLGRPVQPFEFEAELDEQ